MEEESNKFMDATSQKSFKTTNPRSYKRSLRISQILIQKNPEHPWQQISKVLYSIEGSYQVSAKTTSKLLQIQINCPDESSFRFVQQFMTTYKISFHTFVLPEEKSIKIVFKGVPLDVTDKGLMEKLQEISYQTWQ